MGKKSLAAYGLVLSCTVLIGAPMLWWLDDPVIESVAKGGVVAESEPDRASASRRPHEAAVVTPSALERTSSPVEVGDGEPLFGQEYVQVGRPPSFRPDTDPVPVSLTAAAIAVDAAVVGVGVNADSTLEVPSGTEIGWYRFSPRPGEEGSAVLAAHVDYRGEPGAFFDLRHSEPGEIVVVGFDDGSQKRFVIEAVRQYDKDELPLDEIFDRAGEPRLALVTCGGSFNRTARSYDDNVVVYAVPTTSVVQNSSSLFAEVVWSDDVWP